MMRSLLAALFLILGSTSTQALDNQITILALTAGGTNAAIVAENIQYLQQNWPTAGGVTVSVANGGASVPLTSQFLVGTASQQLQQAVSLSQWTALRDQYAADIVILFTSSFTDNLCGAAPHDHWHGSGASFQESPSDNNLDRRGKDDSYRAIIRTNPSSHCPTNILPTLAAHEFGHLLGGGHTQQSGGEYLFDYSHAFAVVTNYGGVRFGNKSIIAEGSPATCVSAGVECVVVPTYSSVGDTDNQATFAVTAASVANYRTSSGGGGGGGCALEPPINVIGSLIAACSPYPSNQHFVSWQHQCSGQVDLSWIWYSQPDGAPEQLGWATTQSSTPVFVTGASSRIRIQACGPSGCSALSASSYLASACTN